MLFMVFPLDGRNKPYLNLQ